MAEHQVKKTRIHLIQDGLSPWLYFTQWKGRQGNGKSIFLPLKDTTQKMYKSISFMSHHPELSVMAPKRKAGNPGLYSR